MAAKAIGKASTPKLDVVNHVIFVLDESGSMQSIRAKTIQTFKELLLSMSSESSKMGQKTKTTIMTFNNRVRIIKDEGQDVVMFDDYHPDGMTALIDAVYSALDVGRRIQTAPGEDSSFLVIIITDGGENASRVHTTGEVSSAMNKAIYGDDWSFVFSVPDENGKEYVKKFLGAYEDNISVWESSEKGMSELGQRLSQGTSSYFTGRAAGKKSTTTFFAPDLSKMKKTEVRETLHKVNGKFITLDVKKDTPIKEFVERSGNQFQKGQGFYQLMKPEDVQDYKEIVLMDQYGKLFSGPEARSLLNMPDNGTIRVRPGDQGIYKVFIQSTSVNRKLIKGTKFIYRVA